MPITLKRGGKSRGVRDATALGIPSGGFMKLKEYHFDLGDSTKGPVGFCAGVRAKSKRQAVKILRDNLLSEIEVRAGDGRVTYIDVYLNPDAITTKDIDSVSEV